MRFALIGLFTLGLCFHAGAQNKDYFQQQVDYRIKVSLDDKEHFLRGFEQITYVNNSPDQLSFIYIHLWPNAYRNKQTALAKQLLKLNNTSMFFASEDELGYIDSLCFKVNGAEATLEFDQKDIDIAKLVLPFPIASGQSVEISTPFKVKIPSGEISRLGHIGESYQITQWYPKPAVYDTAGWHPMPYLNQGEFYSEFGSFDVQITVPKNYRVAATGDLQTLEEIAWINNRSTEDSIWIQNRINNDDWNDYSDLTFPQSSDTLKTVRYIQNRVHDFAWFADKRYRILKDKVTLPNSRSNVDVYTMFTNAQAKLWSKSIEYMRDAIYYYSLWNGNYPYQQATAVDGTISAGGGMEYPNVTVIGSANNDLSLETVIVHEVGHNWFYGILGNNERDQAWLDEGVNSYNEQRYLSTKYPNASMIFKQKNFFSRLTGFDYYGLKDSQFFTYLLSSRPNLDQPINTHSAQFSSLNYGAIVYAKTAVFLEYMRHWLGDDSMDKSMHAYFEENKFKHPSNKNFENAFANTGKSINWFFDQTINSSCELDYKLKRASCKKDSTFIVIVNKGGIAGPIALQLNNLANQESKSIWLEGFNGKNTIAFDGQYDQVVLDQNYVMPEVNRQNNRCKTKGVFRKIEPLQFSLVGKIEQPDKTQVFWLPTIGWNSPSNFMFGATFYNSLVPSKRFLYSISPMFSIGIKRIMGSFESRYLISTSKSRLESIELGIKGKSYAWYSSANYGNIQFARLEPYVSLYVRPKSYSSLWRHHLLLSSVAAAKLLYRNSGVTTWTSPNIFNRIELNTKWSHPIYYSDARVRFEQNSQFLKTELTARNVSRLTKKLTIRSRMFVGFFGYNQSQSSLYNFRMDGQGSIMSSDYAFDHILLSRDGNTMFANQLTESHGGFKIPTAVGESNKGLVAANLKLHYGKLPIGIFADFGLSTTASAYDAGLYFRLMNDVLECYFPLIYSQNIDNMIEANSQKYLDIVRFEINITELNLFQKAKRITI